MGSSEPLTDANRQIAIGATSLQLRRLLGPTAWMVLEELLLASACTDGRCIASVSVRSLAASLGLAKDTVARALSRLRRTGLVTPSQARTRAGTFATGTYVLTVPDSITVATHTPYARRPSRARSRAARPTDIQLSLEIDS